MIFFFFIYMVRLYLPTVNIYLLELSLPTQWKMDFPILFDNQNTQNAL